MILIRTNKDIGVFIEISRIDEAPIRTVENMDELNPYEEGVDYELINGVPQTPDEVIDYFDKLVGGLEKPVKDRLKNSI